MAPRTLVQRGTLLLINLALAACAGGPTKGGALLPVASGPASGARREDILAITTRTPDSGGNMFSGERANPGLTGFGRVVVSIPASHTPGKIEWPVKAPGDPGKNFTTAERTYLDKAGFRTCLDTALAARTPGNREVLLFIHGYNTAFDEAVYRLAQFTFDSGNKGVPVCFSLASRAEVLGYVYDRDSAILSRDAVEATLRDLLADPNVGKINILAHSMGAMLLMETLRQFEIADDRAVSARIASIVLAAPDIDVQVFRYQLARLGGRMPAPTTIFLSSDDRALGLSSKLAGKMPRLGDYAGAAEFSSAEITVVDVSAVTAGAHDRMNHDKVFGNEGLARMVGDQFNEGYGFGGNPEDKQDLIARQLGRLRGSIGEALDVIVLEPARAITKRR
jgi:esterase/lipase superfamily enzyme